MKILSLTKIVTGEKKGITTLKFAKSIGYSEKELKAIPEEANMALIWGNPTVLTRLKEGEVVLDLGSGAGF